MPLFDEMMPNTTNEELSLKIKYLKLKRITELNNKLRNELSRERITASNACLKIVNYISTHKDYTLPEIWGYPEPKSNPFADGIQQRNRQYRHESPSGGCCCMM